MKAVLILFVVSGILALTYGELCDDDYCKRNPCTYNFPPYICRAPSTYRPDHVGKCGCCPTCVILLERGEPCKVYDKELGLTPAEVCREPLRCYGGFCNKFPVRV